LIPGAKAPELLSSNLIRRMGPGSVIVDVAIDQGGCCETSRPTTHDEPIFVWEDVVHYCVGNMPSAVPRTSTYALTNSTLQYVLEISDKGFARAMKDNRALRKGLNVIDGMIVHEGVAQAFGLSCDKVRF
jgi:alanine dehydrogenase